ncbi:hypothetical protein OE09_0824 [Flavobacteriaceae bacterium MAR_2010_72]|nr:hypothetical protein OE09_0824 [Flavobacteriaceae bacterium MAR_2010_72]
MKSLNLIWAKLEKYNRVKNYGKISFMVLLLYLSFVIYRIFVLFDPQFASETIYDLSSRLTIRFK